MSKISKVTAKVTAKVITKSYSEGKSFFSTFKEEIKKSELATDALKIKDSFSKFMEDESK